MRKATRPLVMVNSAEEAKCSRVFLMGVRMVMMMAKTTLVLWANSVLKRCDALLSKISAWGGLQSRGLDNGFYTDNPPPFTSVMEPFESLSYSLGSIKVFSSVTLDLHEGDSFAA